ncbi:hypothetical protein JHK85_001318 [Glycine max]|uniref:Laccase-25 n=1 Tax=Glycine soja TaxID=3848 RepID=A0A445M1H5_GLYSO|nr:hypothetical protein JHK85_001318 [Glycine max]KAG5088669.1 hypothetical protein JHK86_001281 [Glycine max]RZC29398.1 Laccase-25 [Glycine soja]
MKRDQTLTDPSSGPDTVRVIFGRETSVTEEGLQRCSSRLDRERESLPYVIAAENHPIHIHGFNFHVLAQGFGNYNATRDEPKFNFVNPQIRNTISVPVGGWYVIRFQANNPGVWLVHCHLETHLPWGLAMAFEVENGPSTRVPPPPADLPKF